MATVIYARISSDKEKQSVGVHQQEKDCRELAEREGLGEPTVIVDNDVSASVFARKSRSGWLRVLEMLDAGDVEHLIAWHADRLWRKPSDLERVIDAINHGVALRGTKIHTVQEGRINLATADGRLVARMGATIAGYESEHKSERILRRSLDKAAAGHYWGGTQRLGYEADGVTKREPDATILRQAADRVLAGEGTTPVARWVSAQLTAARGEPVRIAQQTLRHALLSPHMAGLRVHWPAKQRQAWAARRKRGEVSGEYPPDLFSRVVKGEWNGIITEDEWRELHGMLRSNRLHARPRRSLLAGILKCSKCHRTLGWGEGWRTNKNGSRTLYATYHCVSSSGGCGGISIGADAVDVYISQFVRGFLATAQGGLDKAMPGLASKPDEGKERARLELMLDELQRDYYAGTGSLTRERYDRLREDLEGQLGQMERVAPVLKLRRRRLEHAVVAANRWGEMDTAGRRGLVQDVVREIWVAPSVRGWALGPEYRCALVLAFDDRQLAVEERLGMLPAPPERTRQGKGDRNARERAKRGEKAARRAAGQETDEERRRRQERMAKQREYRARRRGSAASAGPETVEELTSAQVAELLGVTRGYVSKLARDGVLPYRVEGRTWMYSGEAVRRYAVERNVKRPGERSA